MREQLVPVNNANGSKTAVIRPATRVVVHALAAILAAAAVVSAAAAWRLASGPISLSFLTPYVEDALRQSDSPYRVEFSDTILTWAGWERTLDIRLLDVRAVGAEGGIAAAAPEISISLSVPALLRGMVAPTSLEIIEPKVRVVRDAAGRIELGFGEATDGASAPAELLLADLLAPPDRARAMGYIKRVSIIGADLTLIDRRLGVSWRAPHATVSFSRDGTGIAATASLDLEIGGHTAQFDARARYNSADGTITGSISFADVQPEWFARDVPHMELLAAARFPVSGSLDIVLGSDARVSRVAFDLDAGAGTLALGAWFDQSFDIVFAEAKGELVLGSEKLRLDDVFIDLGGPKIAAQGLMEGFDGAPFVAGNVTVTELPIDEIERYWPREFWPEVRKWVAANRSGGIIRKASASVHLRSAGALGPSLPQEAVTASVELVVGGRTARLEASARYTSPDGGMTAQVSFTDLQPEWFARNAPYLAPLGTARFPVSGSLDVVLGADAVVSQVAFDLGAGAGVLALDEWFDNSFDIASAQAKGVLEVGSERLHLDEVFIDFGGPKLSAQGWIEGFNATPFISIGATVTDLPGEQVSRYWPRARWPGVRRWIAANLSDGIVRKARANIHLRPEDQTGAGIPEEAVRVVLNLEGFTVHYLRPLPAVVGVNAVGTITGKSIEMKISSGQLKRLKVKRARWSIDSLTASATSTVDVIAYGPLRDAMEVLAHPRLGYAQKLGIDPARLDGTGEAEIRFEFVLGGGPVTVTAKAILQDVSIPAAFDGYDLSNGALMLALDPAGMDIRGTVRLNGVPGAATWREPFGADPASPRRFTFRGRFSDAQRSLLKMPGNEWVTGPVDVDIEIIDLEQGGRRWRATAGLRDAAVRLPGLRWSKEPATDGIVQIGARTAPGQPLVIDTIEVAAGDLTASGRAQFDPGGGELRFLELNHLEFGETNLKATMVPIAGGGYSVNLTGASFDLRPYIGEDGIGAGGDDEALPPLRLVATLGRVVINDTHALRKVNAVLGMQGGRFEAITAESNLANGSRLALQFGRSDAGRVLHMTAEDAGAVLRTFGIFDNMIGGKLLLTATVDEDGDDDVVTGELRIDNHRLINAPMLAKVLSVASLTGIFDLLKGEGLPFRKLIAPFTKRGEVIDINDARSYGPALGITMEGRINLATDTLEMKGTMVPAYALNSALGFLPVIGNILVGPRGGGVFAATYRMSGPLDDPDIVVNPLAALAPGVLRKLFFFLEERNGGKTRTQ